MNETNETPPKNLEAEVLSWLNKSGFPLEMRVAKEVRSFGPDLFSQSAYFADPITGIQRETDIHASWGVPAAEGWQPFTFVHLLIECKATGGAWIVFKADDDPEYTTESRRVMLLQSVPSNLRYEGSGPGAVVYIGDPTPAIISRSDTPGYGVREKRSKPGDKDNAETATKQVVSAAYGFRKPAPTTNDVFRLTRWFPVVVTTAQLFTAQLDENGEISLTRTERASVLIPAPTEDTAVEVTIVTESGLHTFMVEFAELANGLLDPSNLRPI
jgi:hypothetical protein